ncbi:hypothetical protein OESDEN_12764 [Oesophagostomum dentatum]|uniref:Uncharacterized protein n=1 Tax=Oesophagostomum dentatum TaxID=61180 RepID=A0A0B1SQ55_OESDE|nr:hypothetical protein OESDEN_12764 [Oesophagostomum dentatum]
MKMPQTLIDSLVSPFPGYLALVYSEMEQKSEHVWANDRSYFSNQPYFGKNPYFNKMATTTIFRGNYVHFHDYLLYRILLHIRYL